MSVDEHVISHLENLSRLRLLPEERKVMQADLEKILGMIDKIGELDLEDVEPLVYMNQEVQKLRDDQVKIHLEKKITLSNAPLADGDHFLVPKVIEK